MLKPIPYRKFLEAGKQWTLPIPFVEYEGGPALNLDGKTPSARLQAPDDSWTSPTVTPRAPQSDPANTGWADIVVPAGTSTGKDGKWELRTYIDNEPAEWYLLTAQKAST